MTTKVALTSDDLHWFDDAFRAWENNDFVGVLDGLNAAVSHFVGASPAIEANDAKDAVRLEWLTRFISGKALRDVGVVWAAWSPENARAAIDTAMSTHQPKESGNADR